MPPPPVFIYSVEWRLLVVDICITKIAKPWFCLSFNLSFLPFISSFNKNVFFFFTQFLQLPKFWTVRNKDFLSDDDYVDDDVDDDDDK